jgi:hypothetical protein
MVILYWPYPPPLITMASPDNSAVRECEKRLACPYFMPVEKFENGAWPHPARLPLGGGWRGHCTAPGHEGGAPSQLTLETFCNLGYASGCSWAPTDRCWDAVRFAVCAPPPAERENRAEAGVTGRTLRLRYVCEKDHRPVESGDLEFDLLHASWQRRHVDPRVQKMAECFLDSYVKIHTLGG